MCNKQQLWWAPIAFWYGAMTLWGGYQGVTCCPIAALLLWPIVFCQGWDYAVGLWGDVSLWLNIVGKLSESSN